MNRLFVLLGICLLFVTSSVNTQSSPNGIYCGIKSVNVLLTTYVVRIYLDVSSNPKEFYFHAHGDVHISNCGPNLYKLNRTSNLAIITKQASCMERELSKFMLSDLKAEWKPEFDSVSVNASAPYGLITVGIELTKPVCSQPEMKEYDYYRSVKDEL
eukprot:NODE_9821_length_562_cov_28.621868_g9182_i0.p1 GENE.NODE_9821_length_562_cov_28.621868_g9182_i0~~NODE_9821_length_562_cov_28.621868_g9182_i0.p1  ORF type:complete len:175 (-),score=37.02 NODE_9821_length_562_cov_28.621868_g9182_i0:38-508(-)